MLDDEASVVKPGLVLDPDLNNNSSDIDSCQSEGEKKPDEQRKMKSYMKYDFDTNNPEERVKLIDE